MARWQGLIPGSLIALWLIATVMGQDKGSAPPAPAFPRVPPTEPADVQAGLRLQQGFRLDLLAAEPLTTDPVAIDAK